MMFNEIMKVKSLAHRFRGGKIWLEWLFFFFIFFLIFGAGFIAGQAVKCIKTDNNENAGTAWKSHDRVAAIKHHCPYGPNMTREKYLARIAEHTEAELELK